MLTQEEIVLATQAVKTLLKHRRIKSNSEIRLFAAIVKDMCEKAKKTFPELNVKYDVIQPENDNKTTAELIAESKNDIEVFLRYLLTEELISSLDVNELGKYSLLLARDIIYKVLSSFEFVFYPAKQEIVIKNQMIEKTINSLWFDAPGNFIDLNELNKTHDKIVKEFNVFIDIQKEIFKPI